jgi:RNA polymerase sigma-70 factor (ECF subfamily)
LNFSDGKRPVLKVLPGSLSTDRQDPQATLREFYTAYGSSVYHRCLFLLKDPPKAEDAMQDVFAKALVHYARFRAEASPLTWLISIATNHCLNLLRAEKAPWRDRFKRENRHLHEASSVPHVFEIREIVRQLLSRLDAETQRTVIHYYVDEMSLEEVANLLGRSVPTIRKRLQEFTTLYTKEYAS